MIDQSTVERIIDSSRIEDVVGDFVSLRKRGVNLLGNCPFHNEKTPSFTVSPAKGIYKCFGCGKGGNSVNFIMDIEQMSYVEALKYLAKKYNIEILEKELTLSEKEHQSDRESMMVVTAFAQDTFKDNLYSTNEGKTIGLSYFKERGFRDDIIEKFGLGYSINTQDSFTSHAKQNGYRTKYLEKTGLTIVKEQYVADRFRGRVMFPIHSVAGKVIGFGGRILTNDKKTAKYLNSPESEIYNKSKTLYGIYFAKRAITQQDKCYLVEGYTDVISLHQAGIENVVASSGTSLTTEQIKLISRFTPNMTIIFDGDAAGIKASFRGINMVLEEGMNVKVLLMPDGEDPDSFAKSRSSAELDEYISANETDFISFKTKLLYDEAASDPIKRANLITDIIETISLIPNEITRNVYVQESSKILGMDEQVLARELAKFRRKKQYKGQPNITPETRKEETKPVGEHLQPKVGEDFVHQEREILRLLILYGNEKLYDGDNGPISVKDHIYTEIHEGEMHFTHELYGRLFSEFFEKAILSNLGADRYFINHPDPKISEFTASLLSTSETPSKFWKKEGNYFITEEMVKKELVEQTLLIYKSKRLEKMLRDLDEKLKNYTSLSQEELRKVMEDKMNLQKFHRMLAKDLGGRNIVKIGR